MFWSWAAAAKLPCFTTLANISSALVSICNL